MGGREVRPRSSEQDRDGYLDVREGGQPPSLTNLVRRISPRPLLLIYAGRGGGGEELNPAYYRAALAPKELWKIAEAKHVGGLQARPRAYQELVTRFFDRALLGPRGQD